MQRHWRGIFGGLLLLFLRCGQAVEWVEVSGQVASPSGTPLCAMVLVNGSYTFSCGEETGRYSLLAPLDEDGELQVQGFCSGRMPVSKILDPAGATGHELVLDTAGAGVPEMEVDYTLSRAASPQGWVKVEGHVGYGETPLCAMVLVNGSYTFSCGEEPGSFSLEAPLSGQGGLDLYGFAFGFQPYEQRLTGVTWGEAAAEVATGYNLFAPLQETTTYLIDNDGNTLHRWESTYRPGNSVYLLENGHLLRTGNLGTSRFAAGGVGGIVEEFAADGTLLWSYRYADEQVHQHHDIARLPNGNLLLVAWELKGREETVAAGRDPALLTDGELWPDHIVEVEPATGEIVWRWHVWDHLIQDRDPTKANYGVVADHPERVDVNYNATANPGQADWNHINGIDYNADLDQILVSVRGLSELWIIDHGTTTAEAAGHSGGRYGHGGDLLYRWGNPAAYGRGGIMEQRLFYQHNAHWIADGLPGGGDILVFNNGSGRSDGNYSSVDEIVPPLDSEGGYALGADGTFGPEAPLWDYHSADPEEFFAPYISGAQRLPNGNTLICDGPIGRFFEVTPDGREVWRYDYGGPIFRVTRLPEEYPGLPF